MRVVFYEIERGRERAFPEQHPPESRLAFPAGPPRSTRARDAADADIVSIFIRSGVDADVRVTRHGAWYGREARQRIRQTTAEKVRTFAAGRPAKRVVQPHD